MQNVRGLICECIPDRRQDELRFGHTLALCRQRDLQLHSHRHRDTE